GLTQVRENPVNVQNVITYDAIMKLENPDPRLFPGMTANVRLLTGEHDNVLIVPSAAFRFRPRSGAISAPVIPKGAPRPQFVYVLDTKGQPSPRQVQTGMSDGRNTEIAGGDLREGDRVIVSQAHRR